MVHMDSMWSPCGVHVDFNINLAELPARKSMWTPLGLHNSTWTHGVHVNSMEECKVLLDRIIFKWIAYLFGTRWDQF